MPTSHRPIVIVAVLAVTAGLLALRLQTESHRAPDANANSEAGCTDAARTFRSHLSGVWLTAEGQVTRVLADSEGRFRHQRFILRCRSGQTLLIVNDVSIGQRAPVTVGHEVVVRGQYVWNRQGGLVHFTHHAQAGGDGGWILYRGKVYSLPEPGLAA